MDLSSGACLRLSPQEQRDLPSSLATEGWQPCGVEPSGTPWWEASAPWSPQAHEWEILFVICHDILLRDHHGDDLTNIRARLCSCEISSPHVSPWLVKSLEASTTCQHNARPWETREKLAKRSPSRTKQGHWDLGVILFVWLPGCGGCHFDLAI